MSFLFKNIPADISIFRLVILIILLLVRAESQAEVYRWVDERGKIHYSDKPHSKQDQAVKMPTAPEQSRVKEAKNRAEAIINHSNKVNQIDQENDQSKRKIDYINNRDKNKLIRLCHNARKDVIALGHGRPVYIKDKGKKDYFLSDQEKNKKIDQLTLFIRKNCKLQLTN